MAHFTGIGLARLVPFHYCVLVHASYRMYSPTTVSDLFASAAKSLPVTSSAPTSSSAESTSSSSVSTVETSSDSSFLPPSSSTQLINAAKTAGASANDTTTSGKSFFQNKPAVIGVFTGVGVLVLLLVCLVACLGRRRRKRQQQLDREMDASFRETMNHAADGWRPAPSLNLNPSTSLQKTQSVYSTASEASGSYGMYTQPPLPLPQQQQQNYDLGHRQGKASDEWIPESPMPVVSIAVRGVVVEPQIVQPRRAQVHPLRGHAHGDSPLAQKPAQSADVSYHADPQPAPLPTIYLSQSQYTVSPLPADAARSTPPPDMLLSPLLPITPTPFPNPFDQQQGEGRAKEQRPLSTGSTLSPLSALPNPYGPD